MLLQIQKGNFHLEYEGLLPVWWGHTYLRLGNRALWLELTGYRPVGPHRRG